MLKKIFCVSVCLLLLVGCTTIPNTQYSAQVILGEESDLIGLYSWPNNDSGESLSDTIKHYIKQTTQRDGLSDVTVIMDAPAGGVYSAKLYSDSPDVEGYVVRIPQFLNTGKLGYAGAQALMKTPIWQQGWRFFLPLGLAMDNQLSVQLLHFPPDYSLTDQDYLGSATSNRWESLLEVNGVQSDNVTLYETIVDIAPIAAPASAGSQLSGTYSYFADYAHQMLDNLAGPKQSGAHIGRPIVAYGSPVRSWVQEQYGVSLTVLGTGYINLSNGVMSSILGANHPSYFWYAAEQSCDDGWDVMQQDLIAARWQMLMGESPSSAPKAVLADSTSYWGEARYPEICQLVREQSSDCKTKPMKNCPSN